jgi:tyrosyl-tRNA synthetase
VALHTPLLPSLEGGGRMDPIAGKMSKSKPDSSILINDPPSEVERKIGKAFCPAKETEGNPILALAKLILFRRRGTFTVARDAKFGGPVTFESYAALAGSYGKGELHPKDLKAGVAAALNEELAPVRTYFEAHPDNLATVRAFLAKR